MTERNIRTNQSEQYTIFSDNPAAGEPIVEGTDRSRVGHMVIQYVPGTLSKILVNIILVLEAEWEKEAISELYRKLDRQLIACSGVGSKIDRETTNLDIFIGEKIGNGRKTSRVNEREGAKALQTEVRMLQNEIESLPETIDDVVVEQYDEIEEIIEAQDLDEGEKRRRVRDKLRVGLEMGLPTIMYEGSTE